MCVIWVFSTDRNWLWRDPLSDSEVDGVLWTEVLWPLCFPWACRLSWRAAIW
jgi:hypothetical protein